MPLILILLLVAVLIFAFRKKIARLLERAEGPIARMRGNNQYTHNEPQEAPYYNAVHL